jgi:N-acyl-L-homoserine lactone synthetase
MLNRLAILRRTLPMVEIISDKSDPRCIDIFRLRYEVVINQCKMKINESSIYNSSTGKYICDEHDGSDATTHYAIRNPNTGKIVSAIRTIDAVKTQLDMEKHNWFQLDPKIKQDGVVEWSRLVSDMSVRKTNSALLLYIASVKHQQSIGINNVTFMVDSRATNLMKYYKRWTICDQISKDAVPCDEYEVGRKSYVMLMPTGKPYTYERAKFNTLVELPVTLGAMAMKSYIV